jgi:hypothetical protein
MNTRLFRFFVVLVLLGGLLGCSKFLEDPEYTVNPNIASDVTMNELLTACQANAYAVMETVPNFMVAMWMQQMAGVAQHYSGYDIFNVTSDNFGGTWFDIYGGGGLADLKKLRSKAVEGGRRIYQGIAKMYEALTMSMTADCWGDIPYSQACQPGVYDEPVYDSQLDAHMAILDLIDSAIADFQAADASGEFFDGSYDFSFDGDLDLWIAAAHSLKARIYINWGEYDPANYALALAEAQQGIASPEGNWKAMHSETVGERNFYWQFQSARFGYIAAGDYLVELLKADGDPRLEYYFGTDDVGEYSGSASGEFDGNSSWLNPDTYGDMAFDLDLLSWSETQYIIAECQYAAGQEGTALATVNATLDGLDTRWGFTSPDTIPRYTGLTGTDLLEAIMLEKYKALFLNIQVWSDWRRTGYPMHDYVYDNRDIPRRFPYADDEYNTNPNTPALTSQLYDRHQNDPN